MTETDMSQRKRESLRQKQREKLRQIRDGEEEENET